MTSPVSALSTARRSPARTRVQALAEFVAGSRFEAISPEAVEQLELRVLDSLGVALGAMSAGPPAMLRAQLEAFGGAPLCTVIGGGRSAPDRTALYNGALVRYLDFNDAYLAPGETCHPSDSLAAVLAAAEYAGASGRDLLTALAVAYQVQCRLSDAAPVRDRGFDHTTHGAYAAAAGVARALRLDAERTANAIAIAGTALNALRVTRTGALSHWKGLAAPWAAAAALQAADLAARGVTGPPEVFEGNKGFVESIAGPFELDWATEDLEAVRGTILKRYNAEIHSQSALEALLELRAEHALDPSDVERIELDTFQVAYDIIGGGEEGDKLSVATKEQADHSLPYMLAVALLDGQLLPAQYEPERIARDDVQELLRRVDIRPDERLSACFPAEHGARLRLVLHDGRVLERTKHDYQGFVTRPMSRPTVRAKFDQVAAGAADAATRDAIADAVERLGTIEVAELTALLGRVEGPPNQERTT